MGRCALGERVQRIMIIGSPGSGKSTLARRLGAKLDLPVYHMDREVHWLPDWQERAAEEKHAIIADIVDRENWVFEGGHSSSYEMRAARADMLIWLDVPVGIRLFRVIRRAMRERGKTRPDLSDNCPERLDMLSEFIRFILRTRRSTRRKQRALFDSVQFEKHYLRSQRSVNRFLEDIT